MGIGIDDAFVISGAFDATDEKESIPDRMEKAIQRVSWPSNAMNLLYYYYILYYYCYFYYYCY